MPADVPEGPAEQDIKLEPSRVAELFEAGRIELIDVRQATEWEAGHIAGARHIELAELPAAADTIDRDKPVVFQCQRGSRSQMAAEAFRQSGWDAYNMDGGLEAWAERGLPLEPEGGRVADR